MRSDDDYDEYEEDRPKVKRHFKDEETRQGKTRQY